MESRTIVKVKKGKKKQTSRVTAAAATSSSAASSTTSTPTRTLQQPSAAVKMEDAHADSAPTHVVRSSPKTKQRFTIEGGEICEQWFIDHIHDPYPSDADKEELACRAYVHYDQISSWFINARMRKWQKLLAQVQKGHVKQTAQMNEEEKQNLKEIAERIKNKEATVRPLTRVSLKGKAKNRSAVDELNEATAAAATAIANIRRSTRQPKPVQYHESELDLGGGEDEVENEVDDDATEVDHDDEVDEEYEIEQFEDDSMSDAFSGAAEGGNEVASAAAASTAVPELYSTSSSQLLSFHLSSTMSMASMNDLQATTTLLSEPQVAGGLSDSGLVPSGLSTPASTKSTPTQTLTSSQQQPLEANHMFLMPRLVGADDPPQSGVLSTIDMMRLSTTGPQPMMMSTGLTNQWQINTPPQTSLNGRDGMMMSLSSASPFMMPLVNSVDMNGVGMMGSSRYVPSNSNDINLIGLPAFNMNSSMLVPPPIVEDSNQTHSATNNSNDGTTISNGGVIRITPAKMGPRVKIEPR